MNYDSTKYDEKCKQIEPGTPEFRAQAKSRLARLMEDAINASRPKAADLGQGAAGEALKKEERHREDLEGAMKE